jgi:hypothetical protein
VSEAHDFLIVLTKLKEILLKKYDSYMLRNT